MKLIAQKGNYTLYVDENGIYYHAYYGKKFHRDDKHTGMDAIRFFAGRIGYRLEDITVF